LSAIRYIHGGIAFCLLSHGSQVNERYCAFQVQHSAADMRPQQRMAELCQLTGVKLIMYAPSLHSRPSFLLSLSSKYNIV
jgi:hypothetical protein